MARMARGDHSPEGEAVVARLARPTQPSTLNFVSDDSSGQAREYDSQPPETPTTLGRYQIQRALGQGGFGTVYLAHDPQLERPVALKVPRRNWFTSAERRAAFVHEARLAARLKHPGLVAVYDVQADENGLYIVEEYVDGQDLGRWWAASSPSHEQIVRLTIEIAEAIGFAHQHGLVHRDLKPDNILIDPQGRAH
jgi:serine/threonine protein kinase